MTFPRWDEGRLCGFLKLAFPRSLKMFQQEPADHTKKVFHLNMFQIQGFWRLITPHHHPDYWYWCATMKPNVTSWSQQLLQSGVISTGQELRRHCVCCAESFQLCRTLWNTVAALPGSSAHGDSPGENTEVGCHALLQGIFPTQGSKHPCLLWFLLGRQILSHWAPGEAHSGFVALVRVLSTWASCISGKFFTVWATREANKDITSSHSTDPSSNPLRG